MAELYYNQEQFNFGKLGPLLRSRRDANFYRAGCKTLSNFRPSIQGPIIKRKGTRFVAEVKDSSDQVRLIPFSFSETTGLVLEFGDQYIRFFKDGDSIFNTAQNITDATQANPVVITYSGADTYANGDEVEINGVVGMTELNGLRFTVANVNAGANTFELSGVDGTGYGAYVSGGTVEEVYEIASPYTASDLANIKYAQIGDIMYLTVGGSSIRPQKLTRIADNNWTIANLDNQLGPVLDLNESTTTMTLSGTLTKGGTSTWTASSATFNSSHVGSVWRIAKSNDNGIDGYARMSAFTSATQANFVNQEDLTPVTTTATTNWNEAAWSDVKGYPAAVALHEERLFWAGTPTAPLEIYGSVSGASYENYDVDDASADDGLRFELAGQINQINWLISDGQFLVGGTLGGLAFVAFDITDTTITPRARTGSSFGSAAIQAVKLNDKVTYIHSNTKTLYETDYDDISLKYRSIDLNDLNSTILSAGVTELQAVEQPDVAGICVSDGDLKIISRDYRQELLGWYEYQLDGDIESVAVVPSTDEDTIWVSVKRTVNGATKRYVEYIDNTTEKTFSDSAVIIEGTATRTFNKLDHLEGKTVTVLGDDAFAGTYTVSDGSITIPDSKTAIEKAIIGLSYNADAEIMPIDVPIPNFGGTTQCLPTRINDVSVVLYNTIGLKVGPSFDALDEVYFKTSTSLMTSPPEVFASSYPEQKDVEFDGDWVTDATICMRNDLPFSATICSLMAKLEVTGK